jgi:Protein of unknown function (DUF3179)
VLSSEIIPVNRRFFSVAEARNRIQATLVVVLTVTGIALFMIPAFIIRPFRSQSASALALAIGVKWIAPVGTAILGAAVWVLVLSLWRTASWWARAGLVAAMLGSAVPAVMARLNYFEWMFRPIRAGGFVAASDAHLADKEMVMTVRMGAEARAYPIRQMAYHHVLNDTTGGVPIVVTY